jgi:hypothetical protein
MKIKKFINFFKIDKNLKIIKKSNFFVIIVIIIKLIMSSSHKPDTSLSP